MKKSIINLSAIVLSGITITAAAETSAFTPFLTLQDAEKYCPPTTNLVFTPANPTPNSAGIITGIENGLKFTNESPNPALSPKSMNPSGDIQGVQFRDDDGSFGYISGNAITCLYSYPGFTGVTVMLTMRGMAS
jgi:hypothetical protein